MRLFEFSLTLGFSSVLEGGKFTVLGNFTTSQWWLQVFLGARPKSLEPLHLHLLWALFLPPSTIADEEPPFIVGRVPHNIVVGIVGNWKRHDCLACPCHSPNFLFFPLSFSVSRKIPRILSALSPLGPRFECLASESCFPVRRFHICLPCRIPLPCSLAAVKLLELVLSLAWWGPGSALG